MSLGLRLHSLVCVGVLSACSGPTPPLAESVPPTRLSGPVSPGKALGPGGQGPPPAQRLEHPGPPPANGFVWQAGHWRWAEGAYQWQAGRWAAARRGQSWQPPAWRWLDGRWQFEEGHWLRALPEADTAANRAPRF